MARWRADQGAAIPAEEAPFRHAVLAYERLRHELGRTDLPYVRDVATILPPFEGRERSLSAIYQDLSLWRRLYNVVHHPALDRVPADQRNNIQLRVDDMIETIHSWKNAHDRASPPHSDTLGPIVRPDRPQVPSSVASLLAARLVESEGGLARGAGSAFAQVPRRRAREGDEGTGRDTPGNPARRPRTATPTSSGSSGSSFFAAASPVGAAGTQIGMPPTPEQASSVPSEPAAAAAGPLPEGHFYVERLLARKNVGRGKKYLVKWVGYAESDSTWEPRTRLMIDVPDMVLAFDVQMDESSRNERST